MRQTEANWDWNSDLGNRTGDYLYIVGSMETVDFGEEGEEKRWLLLDTDEGTVESIPTGAREYRTFHMDIRPGHEVSVMDGVEGAAVRVVLHMQRGQELDINGLRRQILEAGASSVKFEREYDEEQRIQNSDMPEGGETQEDTSTENPTRGLTVKLGDSTKSYPKHAPTENCSLLSGL